MLVQTVADFGIRRRTQEGFQHPGGDGIWSRVEDRPGAALEMLWRRAAMKMIREYGLKARGEGFGLSFRIPMIFLRVPEQKIKKRFLVFDRRRANQRNGLSYPCHGSGHRGLAAAFSAPQLLAPARPRWLMDFLALYSCPCCHALFTTSDIILDSL